MIIKVDVKPEVFARLVDALPKIGEIARADVSPKYREWLDDQNNPKLWATKESRVGKDGSNMPLRKEPLKGQTYGISTRIVRAPFNSDTKLIQAVIEIPETIWFCGEPINIPLWYAVSGCDHPFPDEEFQVPMETLRKILRLLGIFPD